MSTRPSFKGTVRSVLVINLFIFAVITAVAWYELGPGSEFFSILGAAAGTVVLALLLIWVFFRPMLSQQAIQEKGRPARARLMKFWDTGTTINMDPMVGMLVEVTPPDGPPFQAEIKTLVSRLEVGRLRPDASLYVHYNPDDPTKVAFHKFADLVAEEVSPGAPESLTEQAIRMAELADLRQRGLITETAYLTRLKELEKEG